MSIVLGFIAKENVMYGVIGAVADYDVQNIIFLVCVILGCVLLFIMLCMICLAYKRNCFVHWIFVFILTICFVVYTVLGVAIMYAAIYSADQLEELCSESSTSSNDFKDAMDELYETCDTFYCTGVCQCDLNYDPDDLARSDYIGSPGAPAQNVQDCEALIEAAFADYAIDFDDLDDIIEYLDYFGEIESEYDCSGICEFRNVYFFSDTTDGPVFDACWEPIKDEILLGEILAMGIAYLIAGIVLFIVLFVQYGLCCRKKDQRQQQQKETEMARQNKYQQAPQKTVNKRDYSQPPQAVVYTVPGAQGYLQANNMM